MKRVPLAAIAGRPAPESLTFPPAPAEYEGASGTGTGMTAGAVLTRSSIAVTAGGLSEAASIRAAGHIRATGGAWEARELSYAGPLVAEPGRHLLGATRLLVTSGHEAAVAATRAVFAGAAWAAQARFEEREVLFSALSGLTASYEDERIGATIEGEASESTMLTLRRLISFVAGCDVQLLAIERYDGEGSLIEAEHRRERPKIGSSTHSPFRGLTGRQHAAAVAALCEGLARKIREGFPIERIIDLTVRSNGGGIHIGAQLHALAIETAVNELSERAGDRSSRPEQYARINATLHLGLDAASMERLLGLREELLRRGYFHRDYKSQQIEIKFLRDIAHGIVLRLCGYAGPCYDSEHGRVVEIEELTGAR